MLVTQRIFPICVKVSSAAIILTSLMKEGWVVWESGAHLGWKLLPSETTSCFKFHWCIRKVTGSNSKDFFNSLYKNPSVCFVPSASLPNPNIFPNQAYVNGRKQCHSPLSLPDLSFSGTRRTCEATPTSAVPCH